MLIAIISVLYILGYIISYRYIRKVIRNHHDDDWVLIEKITTITISLFSWISIIAIITFVLCDLDLDKKCKW